MDEQQALVRIQRGEIEALAFFVTRYHLRAVRTAYLIVRDRAAAEDIVQSAITRALEACAEHGVPDAGNPWPRIRAQLLPRTRRRARAIAYALTATAALFLLAAGGLLLRQPATVSAAEILSRASAAHEAWQAQPGIHHTRVERYENYRLVVDKGQRGPNSSLSESYLHFQSSRFRVVRANPESGQIFDAVAFDGSHLYSSRPSEDGSAVVIYRVPQSLEAIRQQPPPTAAPDARAIFEATRQDPTVKLVGREQLPDGREVYLLRSEITPWQRAGQDGSPDAPGYVLLAFDVATYQLVERRAILQRDGQELLVEQERWLVDELLPDDAPVAWDFSDLAQKGAAAEATAAATTTGGSAATPTIAQTIAIVDDPNAEHGDQLPEPVSRPELSALAPGTYVLRSVPAGLREELTAHPPTEYEPAFTLVRYVDAQERYLVLQSGSVPEGALGDIEETYQTASGLTLRFLREEPGSIYSFAAVTAPGGLSFTLTSSLPREQVKALAEQLAPVDP